MACAPWRNRPGSSTTRGAPSVRRKVRSPCTSSRPVTTTAAPYARSVHPLPRPDTTTGPAAGTVAPRAVTWSTATRTSCRSADPDHGSVRGSTAERTVPVRAAVARSSASEASGARAASWTPPERRTAATHARTSATCPSTRTPTNDPARGPTVRPARGRTGAPSRGPPDRQGPAPVAGPEGTVTTPPPRPASGPGKVAPRRRATRPATSTQHSATAVARAACNVSAADAPTATNAVAHAASAAGTSRRSVTRARGRARPRARQGRCR